MNRRSSISSDASGEKSSLTPKSSAQNLNMSDSLRPPSEKKLSRQNTFVLEGRPTPENDELMQHNEGMTVVLDHLPENLKPYISMHFRMIREENEDLLQMLEVKEEEMQSIKFEHQKCLDDKKALAKLKKDFEKLNSQHEREKMKTKAIIKSLKDQQNTNNASNKDLIWFGMESNNNDHIDEKNLRLKETKTNAQSISNKRRSAKMRQRNRSSQTTDFGYSEKLSEELLKNQKLLEEKETNLKDLQNVHKKCSEGIKAHNELKKDFENLKVLLENKENEICEKNKETKSRSSQTPKYEEGDKNENNKKQELVKNQLKSVIEEKDKTIEDLMQECNNFQEMELEYLELKRKYRKVSAFAESEKNISKPKLHTRGSQTTLDDVVLEKSRSADRPTSKTKPYVSQLESLKTEMESLRKTPFLFKSRGFDTGHKGDLNGNKEKSNLYSRGSSPHFDRMYQSQQNLSQYDYVNANISRPSSNVYVPSSQDMRLNSRLSPMSYKNKLRSFDSDTVNIDKDGRQNSEKMLESHIDPSLLGSFRLPADGSSRQNSFCLQPDDAASGKDTFESDDKGNFDSIESLSTRCKELTTNSRIEAVKSEKLEEHVKVLYRNIKELEDKLEQANVHLKKERIKAAKLEKSLGKAQIDIQSIITPNHSTSGMDSSPNGRRNLRSAKDGARNTPSKTKMERKYSWNYLTEKGPTIYMG